MTAGDLQGSELTLGPRRGRQVCTNERRARVVLPLVALALWLGAGRARASAALPPANAAAPAELDRMVEAAGLRLHLHCEGSGSPTVVFESGAGSDGSDWRTVQPGVAQVTRACTYDRAGLGYSGGGRKPRTSNRMSDELHALLVAAAVSPPFVLVGHSAGGLNVRLFASDYPEEVVGMVLVDATTERGERLLSMGSAGERRRMRDQMRRGPDGWDYDSFVASMKQAAQAGGLGALPLVVLTRGRDGPPQPGVDPKSAASRFAVWQELQAALPLLSTNSRHIVVPDARHFIQWDAPAVVVRAVRDVVMAARTGGRLDGEPPAVPAIDAPAAAGARERGTTAALPAESSPPRGALEAPPVASQASATSPEAGALPAAAAIDPLPRLNATGQASSPTLWERFRQGGLTMFALLGLSILAFATVLEHSLGFREKRVQSRALFEQAEALWSAKRFAELEALCRQDESIAARIIHAVVRHRAHPYADVNAVAEEIASGALREHLRRTYWLSVAATLGPLIGLFGTVIGMVEAFDAIAASGARGDTALVAGGISKALVTTAAGLMVGIPALGARHFFVSRIQRAAGELESRTNDLVRRWLLTERREP